MLFNSLVRCLVYSKKFKLIFTILLTTLMSIVLNFELLENYLK